MPIPPVDPAGDSSVRVNESAGPTILNPSVPWVHSARPAHPWARSANRIQEYEKQSVCD